MAKVIKCNWKIKTFIFYYFYSKACDANSKNPQAFYMKKDGIDIMPNYISLVTIKILSVKSKGICQAMCTKDCGCSMVRFESSICRVLNYKANDYLIDNSNSVNVLFIKKEWEIFMLLKPRFIVGTFVKNFDIFPLWLSLFFLILTILIFCN
jgi:hypothetical protein